MGGRGPFSYLSDVIIFNTETEIADKVVEEGEFEFQAYGH